jgi:hypothetical protein
MSARPRPSACCLTPGAAWSRSTNGRSLCPARGRAGPRKILKAGGPMSSSWCPRRSRVPGAARSPLSASPGWCPRWSASTLAAARCARRSCRTTPARTARSPSCGKPWPGPACCTAPARRSPSSRSARSCCGCAATSPMCWRAPRRSAGRTTSSRRGWPARRRPVWSRRTGRWKAASTTSAPGRGQRTSAGPAAWTPAGSAGWCGPAAWSGPRQPRPCPGWRACPW